MPTTATSMFAVSGPATRDGRASKGSCPSPPPSSGSTRRRARSTDRPSVSSWALASRTGSSLGGASRQSRLLDSEAGCGNCRAQPEAKASRRSSRTCPPTSSGGAATSASARRRRRCVNLTNDQAAAACRRLETMDSVGLLVLPSCGAEASAGIWRHKPPVAHVAPGGSAIAPHLPLLYQTPSSPRSALQPSGVPKHA